MFGCCGVSDRDWYSAHFSSQYTKNLFVNTDTYAGDTQQYLSFDESEHISECRKKMEESVGEIRVWMMKNMLKLNDEKTEVLVLSTLYFSDRLQETQLRTGDTSVEQVSQL